MSNRDKHFIHKLIFETTVSNKDEYRDISERISNLIRFTITEMLSRQFDELAFEGDDLIIIDRLEINLGNLTKANLEEKIYQGLQTNIAKYIRKLNNDIPSLAKMANFYQWRYGAIEYRAANYTIIRQRKERLFQMEDKTMFPVVQEIDLVNWQTKYAEVLKFYFKAGYIPSNVYLGELEIKDILQKFTAEILPELKSDKKAKVLTKPSFPEPPHEKIEIFDSLKSILKDPIARERFIRHSVESLLTKMEEQKLITREEVEQLIKPIAYQWIDILYARFSALDKLDWMEEYQEESIDKIIFQLYNHKPSAIQNIMYKLKSDLSHNSEAIKNRVTFLFKQMNKASIQKVISALYSKGSYIQTYLNELSRKIAPFTSESELEVNKIAHFGLISFFLKSTKPAFESKEFIDYLQSSFSFNDTLKSQLNRITIGKKLRSEPFEFKERKFIKTDWIDQKEEKLELVELFTHILQYGSLPIYNRLEIKNLKDFEKSFLKTLENEGDTIYKLLLKSFQRISYKEITRNPIISKLPLKIFEKLAAQLGFSKDFYDLFYVNDSKNWFTNYIQFISLDKDLIKKPTAEQLEFEKWKYNQIQKFTKLLASERGISTRLIRNEEKSNFIVFLIKKKIELGKINNYASVLLDFINTKTGVSYKEIIRQFSKNLDRLIPELEKLKSEKLAADESKEEPLISDKKKDVKDQVEDKLSPTKEASKSEDLPESLMEELINKLIPEQENLIISPAKSDIEKGKLKIPYQSETFESDIAVRNAGLVLCWPFLGYYFSALGLLNDKKDFIDLEARERAVFLLQYLAVKQSNAEEHYLTLNKIMVGYPLDEPISGGIVMTKKELDISEALLINVIKQWSALKNMKPDGLRGSFIIRDGVLRQMHNGWRLIVDKKGFDLLLNKIPWSLSMVRFSWVPYIINVEWN